MPLNLRKSGAQACYALNTHSVGDDPIERHYLFRLPCVRLDRNTPHAASPFAFAIHKRVLIYICLQGFAHNKLEYRTLTFPPLRGSLMLKMMLL